MNVYLVENLQRMLSGFVNIEYMNMLNENKVYSRGFETKLEETEKIDLNLGRIMRNIYNLNIIT